MDDKWLALLDAPMTAKTKKNRRFVGYELKKLFGVKYLWVFLFVLLMLNTAIAWYTADHSYAAEEPTQMISEFFEEYFMNLLKKYYELEGKTVVESYVTGGSDDGGIDGIARVVA